MSSISKRFENARDLAEVEDKLLSDYALFAWEEGVQKTFDQVLFDRNRRCGPEKVFLTVKDAQKRLSGKNHWKCHMCDYATYIKPHYTGYWVTMSS